MPFQAPHREAAFQKTRAALLAARSPSGFWHGELSSSALSTATAIVALTVAARARGERDHFRELVQRGSTWLADHANADGGWGDTVRSQSNMSTTCLVWAALRLAAVDSDAGRATVSTAETWIERRSGGRCSPDAVARAIIASYGEDRTFSATILTMCALCGCLGEDAAAWRLVPQLPFELAAFPRTWFNKLRLQVVSYALPALIAVGLVRHKRLPTANPLWRSLRNGVTQSTLRLLTSIQPASGGFLEATPLTSFVAMSLCAAASELGRHPVVERALAFLTESARSDGSWPIDTNLATWVTTLSISALAEDDGWLDLVGETERQHLREWLLGQQYTDVHPYTLAAPGGWAWTDVSGGVPDADDSAGALLALRHLGKLDERARTAAVSAVGWLVDLQNRDGGIPTFCRGWGRLPFDQSSPDLTAHALRAFVTWLDDLPHDVAERARIAADACQRYLTTTQRDDGAWVPLWFGNEQAPDFENKTYGTARVIAALNTLSRRPRDAMASVRGRGLAWLLAAQNDDGGWGGNDGIPSSVEETALALVALADESVCAGLPAVPYALTRGVDFLSARIDAGGLAEPTPIGFYFAKLWYFEKLYPPIFALAALGRARHMTRISL